MPLQLYLEQKLMHKLLHVQAPNELMMTLHKSSLICLKKKKRLEVLTEVEKQMKKLSKMKESLINGGTLKLALGRSPFVASILSKMLLVGAKLQSLETYDGTTDPEDHLT